MRTPTALTMIAAAALAAGLAGCDNRPTTNTAEVDGANAATTADAPVANTAAAGGDNRAPIVRATSDQSLEWGPCPEGFPEGCGLAILQGDPSQPNADALLRVPAGGAIPPHTHSSAERMILLSGQLDVKYQGTPQETLRQGTYAFGPAGRPHRAECRAGADCLLFIAFEGPVDVHPYEGSLD